jgi:acyl-CoA thioesterase-1
LTRSLHILVVVLALSVAPLFADTAADNAKLPDYGAFQKLLKSKAPVTWVITGDSITHGAMHTRGARDYAEQFNERVRWEMHRQDDVWINTGVSGEVTDGLLANFDFRVARFRPAFVSVNLGMNDCVHLTPANFRKNLVELVKKIRRLGAVPVLQVPNTVTSSNHIAKLAEFSAIIREVAKKNEVVLIDHKAAWETRAGAPDKVPANWLNDGIHPNGLGHAEMAKTMFRELGIFDPGSAVCRMGEPDTKK